MNSKDQDLLEQAATLLRESLTQTDTPYQMGTAWCTQAQTWLERYKGAPPGQRATDSRWRDIDPAGDVATQPTPDPPDEADEGETGPPEQELP